VLSQHQQPVAAAVVLLRAVPLRLRLGPVHSLRHQYVWRALSVIPATYSFTYWARSLSRLLGSAVVPAVVAGAWRAAVHHMLRVLLLLRGAVPLLSIAPCDGIRAQHATQLPRTLGCVACTAPVPPWLTSPRECTTHTHTHTVDKQRALRGPTARSADLRVRTKRQERDGNQLLDQWRCQCPGSARPRER